MKCEQAPDGNVGVLIDARAGAVVVTLLGEHDLSTQQAIQDALYHVRGHPRVLVDLSQCTFADSTVICALTEAYRQIARANGSMELVIPPEARSPRRIAELMRLADMIPIRSAQIEGLDGCAA